MRDRAFFVSEYTRSKHDRRRVISKVRCLSRCLKRPNLTTTDGSECLYELGLKLSSKRIWTGAVRIGRTQFVVDLARKSLVEICFKTSDEVVDGFWRDCTAVEANSTLRGDLVEWPSSFNARRCKRGFAE